MAQIQPNDTVRIDTLDVFDNGRITIPAEIRKHYGIPPNRMLAIRIIGDKEQKQFNRTMGEGGRVTIPSRLRRKFGLGDGDSVDIELDL